MANSAAIVGYLAFIVFLIMAATMVAEAQPVKRAKAKCSDRKFYSCYQQPAQSCPDSCPDFCAVNCFSCEPVCVPKPPPRAPPPPKKPRSPPPPKKPKSPPPPKKPKSPPPPPYYPPPPTPASPPPVPQTQPPPYYPPPPTPASPPPVTQTPPPPYYPPPPTPASPPPVPQTPPPASPPPVPVPPTPTVSPPPPEVAVLGRMVSCKNKDPLYSKCYRMEQRCPATCPDSCEVDCVTCSPVCSCNRPGAVCQDPRFVGADGLTFYFHGKKDKDFCIVSDSNLHINAHFIGKKNENMTRDFTWVESLGILFDNHQIFVGAKKTGVWDSAEDHLEVFFDGTPISLAEGQGTRCQPQDEPSISITRFGDTNAAIIEVEGNFQIKANVVPITKTESRIHKYGITDEDCFAHLDLSFKFYSLSGGVSGVLGQTYASTYVSRVKMGVEMPVLGGDKEFSSSDLFSTDCAATRFTSTPSTSADSFKFDNLKCATQIDGAGVVCKR